MRLSSRHRVFAHDLGRGDWEGWDAASEPVDRMEFLRMGCGDPIVMLPGLAGGASLMMPLARLLARRHEVFLVKLRGDQGFFGRNLRQTPSDHASDLLRMMEQMRLERPTIFGASYGGAVALELAVQSPGSVGAMILSGIEARFRPRIGSTIAVRALERLPLPRDSQFVNQFFNVLFGCRPEPSPLVDFVVKTCWETDQGIVAKRLRGLESFDVRDRLWRVTSPTLILAGTRDVVTSPAHQQELANQIVSSRFERVEGAGHVGFLTHRAEFARQVEQMILLHATACLN